MKKVISISIIGLLAFAVLVVWLLKPSDQHAHRKGTSLSSLHRPEGVTTETLIDWQEQMKTRSNLVKKISVWQM